ncbi:MAG TPA: type II secretion system F family protein [Xanthobacteraceae bacterium]|nr:type II secretion system F family protein [Xanthobacteraceae bacterium]
MPINLTPTNINSLIAAMSAISAFLAVVLITWPYLMPDTLGARMRQVRDEREAIRKRERSKLFGNGSPSLRTEPKKIFKDLVHRLNLLGELNDAAIVKRLRMAGYRGQSPVVTFIAARVILPGVMFIVVAFYAFVVLKQLPYPALVKLSGVMAITLLGYYAPGLYLKNRIGKRQKAIRRAWPDALDLLLICVESGMGLESALAKVAEEVVGQCPELAEELKLLTAELSYLPERAKAYQNLAERTGLEAVQALVISLGQAEKYGTSVGLSLRVLAQESRDRRMSVAEKKAAALPPKLTVPMILFFMPVLFAIIIGPAIIQFQAAR